ncbi:MAG TPA: carboxypeptidase regulatory-like domain-containing protein, partial [Bacteroidetes bacterium]|nr:carboxypeptidase regulatory-like domain-containing protein [Bacteroidota bacterium]HEX03765.1 carboxypeptidase regulatory-like domain-containing protein [Bacteroidota bacterium]
MKKLLVLVLSLCVVSFAFANVDKAAVKDALAAHNAGLDLTKAQDATLFEFYGTGNGSGNVIDNFGGPDAGGYSWLDSEEAGGPTFNWFDITGTGTSFIADMGDDTQNGPYPIGFPFMFYGTAFTDVYICSNGALNFDNNYISLGNVELPNLTHGAQIAIFNDDLDPVGGAADAYYETLNDGTQNVFVISCINWYEYPDGGFAITMQYQLYEDGTIQLHYQTVDAGFDIAGGTIGIQDPTRTIGLTVLYNGSIADYPYDGLAIEFANDGPAPDASLSGYVYDDMSNPLEGATVTLNGNGTLSGIDGFYEFPSLFSGIYPYEVSMGGFITETGNLDIAVGANTADFYLVPMEMDADVLIVDVDATPDSGPVIEGILNDLGYTTYYTNDFYGAPFGDYDYVFVFSGIYPNDFDIATGSPEEAACMDYLNAGGNFYLEGGDNFGFTPPTGLLAMLNIDG